jgi:hypothetical protein
VAAPRRGRPVSGFLHGGAPLDVSGAVATMSVLGSPDGPDARTDSGSKDSGGVLGVAVCPRVVRLIPPARAVLRRCRRDCAKRGCRGCPAGALDGRRGHTRSSTSAAATPATAPETSAVVVEAKATTESETASTLGTRCATNQFRTPTSAVPTDVPGSTWVHSHPSDQHPEQQQPHRERSRRRPHHRQHRERAEPTAACAIDAGCRRRLPRWAR